MVTSKNTSIPLVDDIIVLRDFIAVKKVAPQKEKGVIEIVRNDDRLQEGIVMAVGTGVLTANGQRHDIEVDPGDHIVFDKTAAREVTSKRGNKYLVINELSILSVLPE